MIRIVVCDDQAIVRDGLSMLLALDKAIEVVGTAQDGSEVVELAAKLTPDLVLMDLKMPAANGVEATRRIKATHPNTHVLILTTYDDDEWLFDALRAGASGYLLKDTPHAEIAAAIKGTVGGGAYTSPAVTAKLIRAASSQFPQRATHLTDKLTARELDVWQALGRGLSNAAIADALYLSEGTVRNHVSSILAKLEVADRTQAALLAIRHGLE